MPASRVILSHVAQDPAGTVRPNRDVTITKADGTPFAGTWYDAVSGGAVVAAPQTDSLGLLKLWTTPDQAQRLLVTVDGDNEPTDSETTYDPADIWHEGMTGDRTLGGDLTIGGDLTVGGEFVYGGNLDLSTNENIYTLELGNADAAGKGLRVIGADGNAFLTTRRSGGNDVLILGQGDGTPPSSSNLLVYWETDKVGYSGSDFQLGAIGSGQDVGAMRAIMFQHAGTSYIRAGEFQVRRRQPAGPGVTWILECGLHTEVAHPFASHAGNVGVRFVCENNGWLAATPGAVKGNTGVLIEGDPGWNSPILVRDVDYTTHLFRVVGLTSGADVAGDVFSSQALYSRMSSLGGTVRRTGMLNPESAPAGETWAGLFFNVGTVNGYCLQVGNLIGGAGRVPTVVGANGGGFAVGLTPAQIAAFGMSNGMPTEMVLKGHLSAFKQTLSAPGTGYSTLGPKTDERWYRKTSAGAEVQLLDATTTSVIPQAQVVNTSDQLIANISVTPLAFTSENWDIGGFHDNATANTQLIAPTTGRYKVTARAAFASNATGFRSISIRKNGSSVATFAVPAVNGDATVLTVTATVDLTAGQFVDCTVYHNSGAPTLAISGGAPYTPNFDIVQQL